MTFNELHQLYMEKSNYSKSFPQAKTTKDYVRDFLNGVGQVYTRVLGMMATAIFVMPVVLFLAWVFGWMARQVWEVFLIGWN